MYPSADHVGQWMCFPPCSLMISRRLVPSALATQRASPADPPPKMYVIRRLSRDQRIPWSPASSSLWGAPGSGAGSSHVSKAVVLPRMRAMTATRVPSGEMSSPPIPVPAVTSSPVEPVRFAASPLPRNLTQTSVGPRAFERYATHLPSGEIAGAHSRAGLLVNRMMRANDGPAFALVCNLAHIAAETAITATDNAVAAMAVDGRPLRPEGAGD